MGEKLFDPGGLTCGRDGQTDYASITGGILNNRDTDPLYEIGVWSEKGNRTVSIKYITGNIPSIPIPIPKTEHRRASLCIHTINVSVSAFLPSGSSSQASARERFSRPRNPRWVLAIHGLLADTPVRLRD